MKFKFKKFMAAFAVGLAASLSVVFSNSNVFAETKIEPLDKVELLDKVEPLIEILKDYSSKIDVNDKNSLKEVSCKYNSKVKDIESKFKDKDIENFSAAELSKFYKFYEGFVERNRTAINLCRFCNEDAYRENGFTSFNKVVDLAKNLEYVTLIVMDDFRDAAKNKDVLQKVLDCSSKKDLKVEVVDKASNEVVFENDAKAAVNEEKADEAKGKTGLKDVVIISDGMFVLADSIKDGSSFEIHIIEKSSNSVIMTKSFDNIKFQNANSSGLC